MTAPPKYPRVPHLSRDSGATADDLVLSDAQREQLLAQSVVVEEKLDGANVVLWIEHGAPRVATRGGPDATDRGGLRGRLRGWAAEHGDALRDALDEDLALYGEWLLVPHTVTYADLPGPLVVLDVLDQTSGEWLDVAGRDEIAAEARLPVPPRLFTGHLVGPDQALDLIGESAFGGALSEGVVIRSAHPGQGPRIAKLVRSGWRLVTDAKLAGATRSPGPADVIRRASRANDTRG